MRHRRRPRADRAWGAPDDIYNCSLLDPHASPPATSRPTTRRCRAAMLARAHRPMNEADRRNVQFVAGTGQAQGSTRLRVSRFRTSREIEMRYFTATLTLLVLLGATPTLGPDRRPDAALSRRLGDADRLRLRGRHLGGGQGGRRGPQAELAARGGGLPAVLARRRADRLQRQLQRQHRRLRGPDPGRGAVSHHAPSGRRPSPRLDAGRPGRPSGLQSAERPAGLPADLPGRGRGRSAGAACGALRGVRHAVARRAAHRLHPGDPRVPDVEALPGRGGARDLAPRSRDARRRERERQPRQRRTADVARRHGCTSSRTAGGPSATTSGPTT